MKTVEAREKGLEDELTHEQAVVLDYLSADYQLVFHVPTTIPPPCSHDHCINLESGSGTINIQPYHDGHVQRPRSKRS